MKTERVTLKLAEQLKSLHEEGNLKIIEFILNSVKDAKQFFLKYKGWMRAKSAMNSVDSELRDCTSAELKSKISCKKGCSFCCYIGVAISGEEAELLAKNLEENKIMIDHDLLKEQVDVIGHTKLMDITKTWKELPYEKRRCIFLDKDESCIVYEDRPLVCRSYSVISDPSLCDSRVDRDYLEHVNIVQAEMVLSGYLQSVKKIGPLPTMMKEVLG